MSKLGRKLLDKPYALWAVLFVLAPLCMVVYYAFTDTGGAFSLHSVSQIPSYLSTILLSVLYGLAATVICLLLGYPFAYLISKHAARRQRTVVLLVMLPMWMNFLIRTYSWMTILGDSGVINSFLTAVGLEPAKLINTGGAVILGMVYNFLPYMILPIYSVLSKLDGSLIEAAEDLGSSRRQVFRRVVLPMSLSGVLSGITMVFVPALTTFVISSLLGGSKILLIGNVIEQEFTKGSNWHLGSGLSLVLMIFILLSMALIAKYDKEGEGNAF